MLRGWALSRERCEDGWIRRPIQVFRTLQYELCGAYRVYIRGTYLRAILRGYSEQWVITCHVTIVRWRLGQAKL